MTDSSATTMSSRSQARRREGAEVRRRRGWLRWRPPLRSLLQSVRRVRPRRRRLVASPNGSYGLHSTLHVESDPARRKPPKRVAYDMLIRRRRRRPPRPRNKTDCKLCQAGRSTHRTSNGPDDKRDAGTQFAQCQLLLRGRL